MSSTPKTYKDYEKAAEWLLVKLANNINTNLTGVIVLATCLADEFNSGYDEAIQTNSKLKRDL